MDKIRAKQLIKDTFENPFNKDKFIIFIKNLLNKIEEKTFVYQGNFIPESFREYINKLERIGKYNDGENEIDILIVELKKESILERARSMQRNFIAWYLKGSRGGKLKDGALVAFISPLKENWRFSLVKVEYEVKKTPTGKIKIEDKFTPAKRWSFLVGKNERSHTAQTRFISLLEKDKNNPTLEELEEAFNIEPVTREFFDKYRALLINTVDKLEEIIDKDKKVKEEFEEKRITSIDFAKKLLGQIVFLYFLQKKGWFGVKEEEEWGKGPRDFIRRLFKKEYREYKNFFSDILEPLFYEGLGKERKDNYYERLKCKIPFLNGGLFEPIGGYDWKKIKILLPNELFSNENKTPEGDIGDGILDIFDRFNFTVKEDEPLEKDVAIDPELLGKLYEKFNAIRAENFEEYKKALKTGKKSLEKKFNKKFGVYYTPREIVHYMCQQSLIYYLHTEFNGKISKEDLEILIKFGEELIENEKTVIKKEERIKEGKQKKTEFKSKIPESIKREAKNIDEKLKMIKICDPAVGSGAFTVGMMHEIIRARNFLSLFIDNKKDIYDLKRECIENSIYGVDIDSGACEVTKLRLWLSLIVEEENIKKIKPLPNLDYKIVHGNSLLRIEEDLFNMKELEELEKIKSLYFNETDLIKKQNYKKHIEKLIEKISNGHKEFDFKLYFSEVFHQKNGFDIIIANPPYIRQEKIKEQKEELKKAGYEIYNSTSDLYTYFFEKGYNILKYNGVACFISSNKWMRAKYGEKLRNFLKENTEIIELIDFSGYSIFEATVDTNIIIFRKKKPDKDYKFDFVNVKNKINNDIISFIKENRKIILQKNLNNNCWTLADEKILKLKEKIEKIGKPLKNWNIQINFGIKTGYNKAFIIDNNTKENLCKQDPKSIELLKPILRGRDIGKYYYKWAGLWVIKIESGWTNKNNKNKAPEDFFKESYPAIYTHLNSFKNKKGKGKGLLERDDQGDYWWELRDCNYYKDFEKEKIVWQHVSGRYSFSFIPKKLFLNNSLFMITSKKNNIFELKYILGILNSKLGDLLLLSFTNLSNLGKYAYGSKEKIEQLPIPPITSKNKKIGEEIEDLVNKILSITQSEDYLENKQKQMQVKEYENQIDKLVYKLYDLTQKEIKIIENSDN